MRSKKFYQKHLNDYCEGVYPENEYELSFYNDPAPNQWAFDIKEMNFKVILTCSDDGFVTEQRTKI